MTNEIKQMVDELPCYRDNNGCKKSDVIELVEKLTKWNKVEDGLPEIGKRVLMKFDDDKISSGHRIQEKLFVDDIANFYWDVEIIEWKYII